MLDLNMDNIMVSVIDVPACFILLCFDDGVQYVDKFTQKKLNIILVEASCR